MAYATFTTDRGFNLKGDVWKEGEQWVARIPGEYIDDNEYPVRRVQAVTDVTIVYDGPGITYATRYLKLLSDNIRTDDPNGIETLQNYITYLFDDNMSIEEKEQLPFLSHAQEIIDCGIADIVKRGKVILEDLGYTEKIYAEGPPWFSVAILYPNGKEVESARHEDLEIALRNAWMYSVYELLEHKQTDICDHPLILADY